MTQSSSIQSLFLEGPAGRLEALLNQGALGATHAALVCHPHPLFGGTTHNKVVFHAMKALNRFGFPVLRWLVDQYHLPIIFAGFSFGAATALRASCPNPHVHSLIALGLPLQVEDRSYGYKFLSACAKPKLFVSGSRDQFGPRHELEQLVARVPERKQLVIVEGADHFFSGQLGELRRAIEDWVRERVSG